MQKSSAFFEANTPLATRMELCGVLGMQMIEDPGLYMGMPTVWDKSKR